MTGRNLKSVQAYNNRYTTGLSSPPRRKTRHIQAMPPLQTLFMVNKSFPFRFAISSFYIVVHLVLYSCYQPLGWLSYSCCTAVTAVLITKEQRKVAVAVLQERMNNVASVVNLVYI